MEAFDKLRALLGGEADGMISELIDIYLAETPQLLEKMIVAVESGNVSALHMAAHSTKSASANLGGAHLALLCEEIESQAHAGKLTPDLVVQANTAFADLVTALTEYQKELA